MQFSFKLTPFECRPTSAHNACLKITDVGLTSDVLLTAQLFSNVAYTVYKSLVLWPPRQLKGKLWLSLPSRAGPCTLFNDVGV